MEELNEDNIKIKLMVDLQRLVAHYWDELNVDGITSLSCIKQLSEFMLEDLIKRVNEKFAQKIDAEGFVKGDDVDLVKK